MMTQLGRGAEISRQWSNLDEGTKPKTYRTTFPAKGGSQKCPVAGFPGRVTTSTGMRVHFLHWHVLGTVVILEE